MTDFKAIKSLFYISEDKIYLDGNSLGPPLKKMINHVTKMINDEWGALLISGWNKAGWIQKPKNLGNKIGDLIGAERDHVIVGETLSIRLYQALAAALQLQPERRIILSDNGNFPSDLYIAQGLISSLNLGHELRIVDPDKVAKNITDQVAVLLLTEVDYQTSRKHDLAELTEKSRSKGVTTVWDLAHSAGVIEISLAKYQVDFAVGCTYKYLNGGPGAPAFIYVSPRHANKIVPILAGWLGHVDPFSFADNFVPANGVDRMRVGTPPIISLSALEAALEIWSNINIRDVREASKRLTEMFIERVDRSCPKLTLLSPRNPNHRGSHVAYKFEEGYALVQALISRGVIGDFRAPETIRFGFSPLFIDEDDIVKATDIIAEVIDNNLWNTPQLRKRQFVT